MAEHTHGDMSVREHEKTFEAFVKILWRAIIAILVFLVLLAMING